MGKKKHVKKSLCNLPVGLDSNKPSYAQYGLTVRDLNKFTIDTQAAIERCLNDWNCDTQVFADQLIIDIGSIEWLTDVIIKEMVSVFAARPQIARWFEAVDARIEEQRKRAIKTINDQIDAVSIRLMQIKEQSIACHTSTRPPQQAIDFSMFIKEEGIEA